MIDDHRMTLGQRFMHQMIEHHRHVARMVKYGFEIIVKQRQPVFHTGKATPFADRLIKRIITLWCAKHPHVILAETADHIR